jgi:RNA polymerase sigma-70 factor (ECF subfamily)
LQRACAWLDTQMLWIAWDAKEKAVNYSYSSPDRGNRACAVASDARSHLFGGRSKNALPASHVSGSRRSGKLAQPRPEVREWEAVQEIFLKSRHKFVGLAYTILQSKEDAEDAVQDAFLSAYRHLRSFEGRSAFTTWFTRIVLNAALMVRRKRKPSWIEYHPESFGNDEAPWTEMIPTSQPGPELAYAEGETFQLIDALLAKMSPILRQAFTLTYYDQMPYREAGALLGVTTGTFKSRVLRARRYLMQQARASGLAPIRRRPDGFHFTFGKGDFPSLAARGAAFSSPEIALS